MQHTSYLDKITYEVTFKCPACSCNRFERPDYMSICKTFLEGHFVCSNCQLQYGYYDDAFTLQSGQITQSQLTLF